MGMKIDSFKMVRMQLKAELVSFDWPTHYTNHINSVMMNIQFRLALHKSIEYLNSRGLSENNISIP